MDDGRPDHHAAPDNFAFMPGHQFVSINSATMSAGASAGTVYDGATDLLTAATPVTPGVHSLVLSVWDDGDMNYDSAAFIDDIAIFNAIPGELHPGRDEAHARDHRARVRATTAPAPVTGPSTSIALRRRRARRALRVPPRRRRLAWTACTSPKSCTPGSRTASHTFPRPRGQRRRAPRTGRPPPSHGTIDRDRDLDSPDHRQARHA